jgi:hypothetical protein
VLLLLLPCTNCNGDCCCCDERQLRLQLCHGNRHFLLLCSLRVVLADCGCVKPPVSLPNTAAEVRTRVTGKRLTAMWNVKLELLSLW